MELATRMGMSVRLLLIGLSALAVASCAGVPTTIETAWTDPEFEGASFERVGVVALFDTEAESRAFEQRAAEQLEARGVTAVHGYRFLEPNRDYTYEEMEAALLDAEIEGLLIFRLIAVDERRVFRPVSPYMRGMPPGIIVGNPHFWYYSPHWNYYWHWRATRDVVRSSGYWDQFRYMIIETSLYDNETDQLIWTARSETMDDRAFDALADSVVDAVTERLFEERLLRADSPALARAETNTTRPND